MKELRKCPICKEYEFIHEKHWTCKKCFKKYSANELVDILIKMYDTTTKRKSKEDNRT